ncbi:YheC/YheD family protein [Bacillus sp. JJ1521]|uniref:YheC/YheD family protein n=1 Tax=Bacillus sp. JJ1521 TaxID=3122957 RepID=UPI0030005BD8
MHKIIRSKMKKTIPLLQDPILSRHVPETHWFSTESLKTMVQSHPQVYIKPNIGRKGSGISRVKRISNSEYELSYENITKRVSFTELVKDLTGRFSTGKSYLVQQGIDLATFNDGPFHIRVVMQKVKNCWRPSLMSGVVAKKKDAVVTNIARGNFDLSLEEVLQKNDQKLNPMNTVRELTDLSHQIVHVLGSSFPLLVIGLDMGIDKQGKVWFIEANTNPDSKGLDKVNDKVSYQKYLDAKKWIRENEERV